MNMPGCGLRHALLAPDERAALEAMDAAALWGLERKRDVDLDAIYGPGTVALDAAMCALVLLRWRRDDQGLRVERLAPAAALQRLDVFRKDLGAFDLDRTSRTMVTAAELEGYRALVSSVPVLEVAGRVDFRALVGAVAAILAG
jgi:HprK-related kinase B